MTDFIGEVEQELIDATDFKPERNYRDRQKYLNALLRACSDLTDDQFNHLSDPAADWCNEAAGANKDGYPIPDFKTNGGAHAETTLQLHTTVSEEEQTEVSARPTAVGNEAGNETGPHVEDPPKAKKKGGRPKGSKTKKASVPIKVFVAKPEPKKSSKPRPTANENIARKAVMGVNLWGVTIGCKADIACKLAAQEGGASMNEIREATGGSKYNLFNRLQKNGYELKWEGGRIYLAKPVYEVLKQPEEVDVE